MRKEFSRPLSPVLPSLFLVVAIGVVLPLSVFTILRMQRPIVDGGYIDIPLAVVHVERNGGETVQTEITVLRDGSYWVTEEHLSFLGIASTYRQFRGALPDGYPLARVRALAHSTEFQRMLKGGSCTCTGEWYIEVREGTKRSAALSEEAFGQMPGSSAVREWFALMDRDRREHARSYGEESSWWPDIVGGWCDPDERE